MWIGFTVNALGQLAELVDELERLAERADESERFVGAIDCHFPTLGARNFAGFLVEGIATHPVDVLQIARNVHRATYCRHGGMLVVGPELGQIEGYGLCRCARVLLLALVLLGEADLRGSHGAAVIAQVPADELCSVRRYNVVRSLARL